MSKEANDKIIDDFMGIDTSPIERINRAYNKSWGKLMPVCMKIKDIDNNADEWFINQDGYKELDILHNTSILCNIQEVYDRVIMFIKWYNNLFNGITI